MKPIETSVPQQIGRLLGVLGATLLLAATVSPARAGIIVPELSIVGGTGVAGGTVDVTVALSDDVGEVAASADVDIIFPPAQLTFHPPVVTNCEIDPRLADTHQVGGRIEGDDTLILSIFVKGSPPVIPHLGNGPLASCAFQINEGVPAGTAALELDDAGLFDDQGNPLDVTTANGFVTITDFVSPTPTATFTPPTVVTATATATGTPTGTAAGTATSTPTNTGGEETPTATPTTTGEGGTPTVTPTTTGGTPTATTTGSVAATATATNTVGVTATVTNTVPVGPTSTPFRFKDSSSCSVVPVDQQNSGGMLALLLAPALLVWARRRRF